MNASRIGYTISSPAVSYFDIPVCVIDNMDNNTVWAINFHLQCYPRSLLRVPWHLDPNVAVSWDRRISGMAVTIVLTLSGDAKWVQDGSRSWWCCLTRVSCWQCRATFGMAGGISRFLGTGQPLHWPHDLRWSQNRLSSCPPIPVLCL